MIRFKSYIEILEFKKEIHIYLIVSINRTINYARSDKFIFLSNNGGRSQETPELKTQGLGTWNVKT